MEMAGTSIVNCLAVEATVGGDRGDVAVLPEPGGEASVEVGANR